MLWGKAAEREAALNRLMPLGPFEPDAPWNELPQAFMAMEVEYLGAPWHPHGGCSAASHEGSTSTSWSWTTSGTGPLQWNWWRASQDRRCAPRWMAG
jgi:hypothetical protein